MKDQDLASVDILKDENEWNEWHSVSDPVLHIEVMEMVKKSLNRD